jgi:hypothetical protein
MDTGTEAPRKSTALVVEPLSGGLWKNRRFLKKAMLEPVGVLKP